VTFLVGVFDLVVHTVLVAHIGLQTQSSGSEFRKRSQLVVVDRSSLVVEHNFSEVMASKRG
jgi:hypothetical protein